VFLRVSLAMRYGPIVSLPLGLIKVHCSLALELAVQSAPRLQVALRPP